MTSELGMTPAEVLERAADLLETVGHCKGMQRQYPAGQYFDGSYGNAIAYCATGAMDEVTIRRRGDFAECDHLPLKKAIEKLALHLRQKRPNVDLQSHQSHRGFIEGWNDLSRTSASCVIDTMKEVAKDLRNRGEVAA